MVNEQLDMVAEVGATVEHLPEARHLVGDMEEHLAVVAHDATVVVQQLCV